MKLSLGVVLSAASCAVVLPGCDSFHPVHGLHQHTRHLTFPTETKSVLSSSSSRLYVSSSTDRPDTTTTTTDTSQLGLEHAPIALFGKGQQGTTGSNTDKHLLGGKGANLAEMSRIGLSVPPGFTITTECCKQFCGDWNQKLPPALWKQIQDSVSTIETAMDAQFGSPQNPLLLSVRSGAAISMPGMMDTVLNLGMNDGVVEGLASKSGNPRFAWDSYRRFLEMFGNVVLNIPRPLFEDELDNIKYEAGVLEDAELSTEQLQKVVERFKAVYDNMGLSFPEDVYQQLELAIGAVFQGWMGDRAVKYRQVENIRNLLGTAVNVQAMVFGNMGDSSGTGVCFTRDPNHGENKLFGEFLINAQGEDVVAGIRTPKPIDELEAVMPGTVGSVMLYRW